MHLPAIAVEHRAELHSDDLDFERFPGLRFRTNSVVRDGRGSLAGHDFPGDPVGA